MGCHISPSMKGLVASLVMVSILQVCLIISAAADDVVQASKVVKLVPAMYVFGDSTLDVGNNNYLPGPNVPRANMPLNGVDFPGGARATGRFSNGYHVADFIEHSSAVNNTKSGVDVVFKIALPVILVLLSLTCIYLVCICKPKGIQVYKETLKKPGLEHLSTSQEVWDQNLEFRSIRFENIATATNSFHDTNILGKGGFGKVYKV